jgi:PAS domain S-box-containing protein
VALAMVLVALLSILGYLFGAKSLYGVAAFTEIALQTSVGLLLLGAGTLLSRPEAGFMRRVVADNSGAFLIRRLLPAAILLPVTLMWIRMVGEHAGLFDPDFDRVLSVLAFIITFVAVIWWTGGLVHRQEIASERARFELQGRLVQSLESMADAFLAYDREWRVTYMNAAAEKLTSLSRDQVLGRTAWEAFPDMVGTEAETEYRRAMQERTPARFELFYEPYGRYFEIDVFPTPDGGLAVYGRDVTTRRHALDALQESDRRKDQFLATLAHELRNPLAPVRNAVQVLRLEGRGGPEVQWAHAVIDRQVDHLARLIDDLMDVSRISHNKLELRKSPVALIEVVTSALESSRPSIEANGHTLTVTLPNEPLLLEADTVRLAQTFMNLLTNAAKYTPPGGKIALDAVREGSDVVVRVTDDGVGLARDQIPRLFEMFFQTEDVLKRARSGLGIGLALVRHLVELHGGSVTAHSPGPDKGSVFTVRLPLAPKQRGVRSVPSAASAVRPHLRGQRVLVVDDNKDAAFSLGKLLEIAGAEVQTAYDGEDALLLVEQSEFDVALLDIGLPTISGYELAQKIRKTPWGPGALLIALTGWGQAGDRERSGDAGFDHHLVKPVSLDALLRLLDARRIIAGQ